MFKKIPLGIAIAAVFSTACYAQNQPSPAPYHQDWLTDAVNTYNQFKNEPCSNCKVAFAVSQLENDQSSMASWINSETTRYSAPQAHLVFALR